MNFITCIEKHAISKPKHMMLKLDNGVVFSYQELHKAIREVSKWLRNEHLNGTTIAINISTPFEYICCLIACLDTGCRVLPIYPKLHIQERKILFQKIKPSFILTEKPVLAKKPPVLFKYAPGEILHLTSGSYRAKKIVVRPYGNLIDEAFSVSIALQLKFSDTVLISSPIAHSFGCGMLRSVLYAGATLALVTGEDVLKRIAGIRKFLQQGVSIVTGVPYIYELLLRQKNHNDIQHNIHCYSGGDHLTSSLAKRWKRTFNLSLRQEYGLSEGGITTFASMDDPPESIGSPIPNVKLKIIETDTACVGELVVYRSHPPRQYLFEGSSNIFQSDGGIRTGDLAKKDKKGRYYLAGRKKAIINVAGLKVNPREVETWLKRRHDVEAAVVMGVPDKLTGERPIAFIKTRKREFVEQTYKEYLRKKIAKYKIPKKIILIDEIPRTELGKVDYTAIKRFI